MSRQGQKIQGQNGKMIDRAKNVWDKFAQAKRSNLQHVFANLLLGKKKAKKMQPKATKFSWMHFFAHHVSRKTDIMLMVAVSCGRPK